MVVPAHSVIESAPILALSKAAFLRSTAATPQDLGRRLTRLRMRLPGGACPYSSPTAAGTERPSHILRASFTRPFDSCVGREIPGSSGYRSSSHPSLICIPTHQHMRFSLPSRSEAKPCIELLRPVCMQYSEVDRLAIGGGLMLQAPQDSAS